MWQCCVKIDRGDYFKNKNFMWIKGEKGIDEFYFIGNKAASLIAMRILFPQSYSIFMKYYSSALKRISHGLTDETPERVLSFFNKSIEMELQGRMSGMSMKEIYNLSTRRIGKVRYNYFLETNLKKEAFLHIFENPDKYEVLNWNITAPFDFEKNEYVTEKAKYSVEYWQYREPINSKSREKNYSYYTLCINEWDKKRKETVILRKENSEDRYYFCSKDIEKISKYPGIEIVAGNVIKLTAINHNLQPLK